MERVYLFCGRERKVGRGGEERGQMQHTKTPKTPRICKIMPIFAPRKQHQHEQSNLNHRRLLRLWQSHRRAPCLQRIHRLRHQPQPPVAPHRAFPPNGRAQPRIRSHRHRPDCSRRRPHRRRSQQRRNGHRRSPGNGHRRRNKRPDGHQLPRMRQRMPESASRHAPATSGTHRQHQLHRRCHGAPVPGLLQRIEIRHRGLQRSTGSRSEGLRHTSVHGRTRRLRHQLHGKPQKLHSDSRKRGLRRLVPPQHRHHRKRGKRRPAPRNTGQESGEDNRVPPTTATLCGGQPRTTPLRSAPQHTPRQHVCQHRRRCLFCCAAGTVISSWQTRRESSTSPYCR